MCWKQSGACFAFQVFLELKYDVDYYFSTINNLDFAPLIFSRLLLQIILFLKVVTQNTFHSKSVPLVKGIRFVVFNLRSISSLWLTILQDFGHLNQFMNNHNKALCKRPDLIIV